VTHSDRLLPGITIIIASSQRVLRKGRITVGCISSGYRDCHCCICMSCRICMRCCLLAGTEWKFNCIHQVVPMCSP